MYMQTLISSLIEVFILILVGYVIRKKNILSEYTISDLSNLLLYIILPLSIISSGSSSDSNLAGETLFYTAIASFLYYAISFIISFLLFTFLGKKDHKDENIMLSVFANTGFIGMPLAKVLYGTDGLLFAVIFNLFYNLFFYTLGQHVLGRSNGKIRLKSIILNPLTISSCGALLLFVFKIKIPDIIMYPVEIIGDMTVPVSMFIIGADMVKLNMKHALSNKEAYLVSFVRLLLYPAVIVLILNFIDLDSLLKSVIVLLSALPIGSLTVIFSKQYQRDSSYANEAMVISMLLCVFTLPLIVLFASRVL